MSTLISLKSIISTQSRGMLIPDKCKEIETLEPQLLLVVIINVQLISIKKGIKFLIL